MVKRAAAPELMFTVPLVLAVRAEAASEAVIVRTPAVLKVKLDKDRVPETSVIFPAVAPLSSAIPAALSELVRITLGVEPPTTFQFASTALTTTPLVSV